MYNKTTYNKKYMLTVLLMSGLFFALGIVFLCIYKPFVFLADLKTFPDKKMFLFTLVFFIFAIFFLGLFFVEVRNNGKNTKIINKRRTLAEKSLYVFMFIFMVIYTLVFLYLLVWGFLSSLKTNREFFRNPTGLPEQWLFSNYVEAFKLLSYNGVSVIGMIGNSLYFAIASSALSIFFHCCTGYVFAKYNFKCKSLVFAVVIFTMIIPIFGNLAPLYKLLYDLKITDSYFYVVICCSGFGGNFLITHAFFKGIDRAYAEAAMIDGAGHMRTYLTIMLPLAKPIVVAFFITNFIASWNDYMTALLFLDSLPTLATGLYYYQQELKYVSNQPYYFAGVFISMVPTLIIFGFFADKVMNSLVIGGLKG